MSAKPKILVVDDEEDSRLTMRLLLEREGYAVRTAANGQEALAALAQESFAVMITDLRMPGMSGEELMARILPQHSADLDVIVLTGYGTIASAVEALHQGAQDYWTKPVDPELVKRRLRQLVRGRLLEQENQELRAELARRAAQKEILGESEEIRQVLSLIDRVAAADATVLIEGESGVGKELVAHAIHHRSKRRNGPFIKVSCAALPENLLEVELFGAEKGAYTDAHQRRMGRFELAHGGTLFLDEIGDITPAMQVKLLRVLQERQFERVGGVETISVDVRLIAATNQDLLAEDRNPPFRRDLYYRLNVIPIEVPPLRERRGDIALLAQAFLERFSAELNRPLKGFTPEALKVLQTYRWPGNVRELENAIERAMVLSSGDELDASDFDFLRSPRSSQRSHLPTLEEMEQEYIRDVLRITRSNKNKAAEILGVHRETLYNKIKKYGLES
jgi:DNA-binding NtrC family response regulator